MTSVEVGSQDCTTRTPAYDPDCRLCPRLAGFLDEVRARHPDYWARPVPSFGDADARFLIVGLAPGLHGANATGRPFTGDWCGPLLYSTLHRHGFAAQATSDHRGDGQALIDCRIANGVKCLPPANKPELSEIRRCLSDEVVQLRAWVEATCAENREAVLKLRREISSSRQRLDEAERLAFTDELTGFGNRREGERDLAARIASKANARFPCFASIRKERVNSLVLS